MTRIILYGIGTDVGKTYCLVKILQRLFALLSPNDFHAIKPIISGWDGSPNSDIELISKALQRPFNEICKFYLSKPLSPDIAAEIDGIKINFQEIVDFCKLHEKRLFIETAGGVFSPLTQTHTMADLHTALGGRTILMISNYLGCISHTISAIRGSNFEYDMLIFNPYKNQEYAKEVANSIERFTGKKLYWIDRDFDEIVEILLSW